MPITVLSPEESAVDRRRVKADGDGGDTEREAWKFLSHSKNSLDLAEIVNSVEPQEPKSGAVECRLNLNVPSTETPVSHPLWKISVSPFSAPPPSSLPLSGVL